jgi:hypothetical protein
LKEGQTGMRSSVGKGHVPRSCRRRRSSQSLLPAPANELGGTPSTHGQTELRRWRQSGRGSKIPHLLEQADELVIRHTAPELTLLGHAQKDLLDLLGDGRPGHRDAAHWATTRTVNRRARAEAEGKKAKRGGQTYVARAPRARVPRP